MFVKGKVVPVHAIKAYGEAEVQFHSFLTWALNGASGQSYVVVALPPWKAPPVPVEYKAQWVPESERTFSRMAETLAPASNRTTTARSSTPQPSHYTD